jgi:hypothetical protein
MKYLFLIFLTSCASSKGYMYGRVLDSDLKQMNCKQGTPYYRMASFIFDANKQITSIQFSYQCKEDKGQRKYLEKQEVEL